MEKELTWDDAQMEAVKHFQDRFDAIRYCEMKEPEWQSALGAFFVFLPMILLAVANFL